MLGRSVRILLVALALITLTWCGVVLWWRQHPQVLGAGDITLGLIVMPLVVCAGVGLAWLGFARMRSRPSSDEAATPAVVQSEAGVAATRPEAWVLAVGIASAAGTSAEAVCDALSQGEQQPAPCFDFIDFEGLPVRLARAETLMPNGEREGLAVADDAALSAESLVRVLALLPDALNPVVDALVAAMPARSSPHATPRSLPVLVRVLAPKRWDEAAVTVLQQRIERLIAARWLEVPPPVRVSRDDGVAALAELQTWLADDTQTRSLLLVAADSLIDTALIDAAAQAGQLSRHDLPEGLVPGEAVAAIWCARPGLNLGVEPLARLSSLSRAQRDAVPTRNARINAAVLESLLGGVLETSGCPVEVPAALVSEGDVRPSCAVEAAMAMNTTLPHLDPVADRIAVGVALGDLGAAGTAVGLVLAAAKAREALKPVMLASLSDPLARGVALMLPYEPEPAVS